MKTCTKCGETKEFSGFYKCGNGKYYMGACKKCIKKRSRINYADNREDRLKTCAAWSLKNKDKTRKYKRDYYEKNYNECRERSQLWNENNREACREHRKKWNKNNPEKLLAKAARRRASVKELIPNFIKDCDTEKERVNNIYKLCKLITTTTGVKHHVDHMWPIAEEGPHWSGNLQIITAEENRIKGAAVDPAIKATIQEMLAEEERLHAER